MVLAEAYNLLIRSEAIHSKFQGGYDSFLFTIPNETHVTDGELERVGFMSFDEMFLYARVLMGYGLKISWDFCLFSMIEGPMVPCNWIDWLRYEWFHDSKHKFTMAWLKPENGGQENPEVKKAPELTYHHPQ